MFKNKSIFLLIGLVLLPPAVSKSQSSVWNANGANDNFSNPANWSNGVPGPSGSVNFVLSDQPYDVVMDQDFFVASCNLSNGTSTMRGPGKLTIDGQLLSTNHHATFTDQFCLNANSVLVGVGGVGTVTEWTTC